MEAFALVPGESREQSVSWLDFSEVGGLSDDGGMVLLRERWAGGGRSHITYLRKTDGSPAIRLAEGRASGFSPDGKHTLLVALADPRELTLLPTGTGEPKRLDRGLVSLYLYWGDWFPDGRRILFKAVDEAGMARWYVQGLDGGPPRAILAEGHAFTGGISPDGASLTCWDGARGLNLIVPVDGGEGRPIPGSGAGPLAVVQWSPDGRFLYVRRTEGLAAQIRRLEISSGRQELWKTIAPADPGGVAAVINPLITPDGKGYAYSILRFNTTAYVADALR
jgi:hypothetical protein